MSVIVGITGIVLAGGMSRRMGTDKAFVEIEGVPMIQRVLRALAECCFEVLIATKDLSAYEHLGVRGIPDRLALQAPLVGVCSGLRAASTGWAFVVACDMPHLSPDAVRLLARLAEGHDAAVPWVDGRWHPLHAVYATSTLPLFESHLAAGELRMWAALESLRVRRVTAAEIATADPDLRTLHNANTAQERRSPGGQHPASLEE